MDRLWNGNRSKDFQFHVKASYFKHLSLVDSYIKDVRQITSRVRPIPVSGIGRYLPVLVGVGIGQYLFEYQRQYQ